MKYGVLYNKSNVNIGDDIQAYATARFLPQVDYFIDREHIDEFVTEDKKACAVIMNAWYMWAKWNWPPSKYIYPHFVGMHYADHQLAVQPGSYIKYEFLEGIGGEYLKSYGPIGCRDKFTLKNLQNLGIDSFYSGCITLTLPKQPERENKGTYICLVDLEKDVRNRMKELLKDSGVEVKVFTHARDREPNMPWEQRLKLIKERLTIYQNARCVVTKKLHCSLPCLAMGVPVFLIKGMESDIRFDPYYDFLHRTTVKKFLAGDFEYDFLNPPENKPDYKIVRENLIKSCEEFVERTKHIDDDPDKLNKITYTEDELIKWRHDTMKKTMTEWLEPNKKNIETLYKMDEILNENCSLRRQMNIDTDHRVVNKKKKLYKLRRKFGKIERKIRRKILKMI